MKKLLYTQTENFEFSSVSAPFIIPNIPITSLSLHVNIERPMLYEILFEIIFTSGIRRKTRLYKFNNNSRGGDISVIIEDEFYHVDQLFIKLYSNPKPSLIIDVYHEENQTTA